MLNFFEVNQFILFYVMSVIQNETHVIDGAPNIIIKKYEE